MSKFISTQEHPEEHQKIIGFVQRFKTETEHKVHSQILSKESLEKLMSHENFDGIKIHYGRDDEGTRQMIMEAIDPQKKSLGQFIAQIPTCPPWCNEEEEVNEPQS
jgi:hypothetical protein